MTITPLYNSIQTAFKFTGVALILGVVSVTGFSYSPSTNAQVANISEDAGQIYTVKSGDGLYKLGRQFYGKGSDYKKIVKAHNAKAATDSRFKVIDPNQGLSVGQLIWVPVKPAPNSSTASTTSGSSRQSAQAVRNIRDNAQTTVTPKPRSATTSQSSSSSSQESLSSDVLATDYSIPKPRTNSRPDSSSQNKNEDPAYVVTPPKSDCEIRIWYNFQIVAIKKINERWKEQGLSVVERAKRAYQMRHQARLNGRYMMEDKFEVAALRDRDNKKYGNPDGPTFEHMVAFGRENGLTGDRVYEGIIESSARVQPVYKSSCVN